MLTALNALCLMRPRLALPKGNLLVFAAAWWLSLNHAGAIQLMKQRWHTYTQGSCTVCEQSDDGK